MTEIQSQLAHARVNDLRLRLASIRDVLRDTLTATTDIEEPDVGGLQRSIRALQAVSAEFESLCDAQVGMKDDGSTQDVVARAKSEVASGEFDSQS